MVRGKARAVPLHYFQCFVAVSLMLCWVFIVISIDSKPPGQRSKLEQLKKFAADDPSIAITKGDVQTWEESQRRRQDRIRSWCEDVEHSKTKHDQHDQGMVDVYANLFVDDSTKTIICPVDKDTLNTNTAGDLRSLASYNPDDIKERIKDYVKITFIIDPIERLFLHNRKEGGNYDFHKALASGREHAPIVPYMDMCRPCEISYDITVKSGPEFQRDMTFIDTLAKVIRDPADHSGKVSPLEIVLRSLTHFDTDREVWKIDRPLLEKLHTSYYKHDLEIFNLLSYDGDIL